MPIKNAKALIRRRFLRSFHKRAHPAARFLSWIGQNEKRRVTRAVNTTRPLRPPCEQQAVMLEIPVSRAYTSPVINRARKKKDP